MTDRMTLDAFEAKNGAERVMHDDVEAALRAVLDAGTADASSNARRVVMALDVFQRSDDRLKLYQYANSILKASFDGEARSKLVEDKSLPCSPTGWRSCSRKSRSKLTLPDGKPRAACFQHEDSMVSSYVGQKFREVFPADDTEDDGGDRLIEYREKHEGSKSAYDPATFSTVTVAEIWKRLAIRLNKVLDALPAGEYRDAFDAQVAKFESAWGKV